MTLEEKLDKYLVVTSKIFERQIENGERKSLVEAPDMSYTIVNLVDKKGHVQFVYRYEMSLKELVAFLEDARRVLHKAG